MDSPKARLDKMISELGDSPFTPIDRPKADLAVQLAKQFKNSVTFGKGGIRTEMDVNGRRFTEKTKNDSGKCNGENCQ